MPEPAHHTTDKELFARISEGDELAYRELYHLYGKLLFPFLLRLTNSEAATDDLLQETLLRVWLGRDQLTEVEYPRAWIHRIASNLAINWLKRKTVGEEALREISARPDHDDADPLANLSLQSIRAIVQKTLGEMPPQRRRIWSLHRENEMKTTEIAEELGISNSTVKNTLAAAARTIREQLEKAGYTLPLWLILHAL